MWYYVGGAAPSTEHPKTIGEWSSGALSAPESAPEDHSRGRRLGGATQQAAAAVAAAAAAAAAVAAVAAAAVAAAAVATAAVAAAATATPAGNHQQLHRYNSS